MIRRHMGEQLYLIPQNEHARLSGQLAAHYGNAQFEKPEPAAETVRAASIHDGGWPIHDERPTLNKEQYPLDVFESPLELAVRVWRESVDRAAGESDYTQLLVSLHVLGLSGYAASRPHTRREIFELNKFQQYEIERQERLRGRLGLATDIPLRLGLAEESPAAAEQKLCYDLGIIQTADRVSLALCCTGLVFPQINGIARGPGEEGVTLNLRQAGERCLEIEPWPFDEPELSVSVPYRVVPSRRYEDEEEFRGIYAAAEGGRLEFTVRARV
ncbi:MAG: DUF3891 family protein [Bacillota bacterium]